MERLTKLVGNSDLYFTDDLPVNKDVNGYTSDVITKLA